MLYLNTDKIRSMVCSSIRVMAPAVVQKADSMGGFRMVKICTV